MIDTNIIRHKGIIEEVFSDAPFIGARINAISCSHNCPGCFNKQLLDDPIIQSTPEEIIEQVKSNPIHQGLILGGLEWTEHLSETRTLIFAALEAKLQVILYTHHDLQELLKLLPELEGLPMYVKCGEYLREGIPTKSVGVSLASNNQCIYWLGMSKGAARDEKASAG